MPKHYGSIYALTVHISILQNLVVRVLLRTGCFVSIKNTLAPSIYIGLTVCAGIFKQSMGARNLVGIGLSCRPARLHSLAYLVPCN
jgi:hypothetical protein